MKKAQGLPLNAIILAVIAILVLVIIVGLTTGFFTNVFGKEVSNQCALRGGTCYDNNACPTGTSPDATGRQGCINAGITNGPICCVAKVI